MNSKTFLFKDIFEIKRGKRHKKDDHLPGKIRYISSRDSNNGIDGYISNSDIKNLVIEKNVIGINNSGSIGKAFYHSNESIFSDHVTILKLKNKILNENIALFLCSQIEKIKNKYFFGREMNNERLENEKIALPINEKNEIDFDFMESYIKKIKEKISFNKKINRYKKISFSIKEFKNIEMKNFRFGDFLKFTRGSQKEGVSNLNDGKIPYVTSKATNNGIAKFVETNTSIYSDSMTISLNGGGLDVFYQEGNFTANGDIGIVNNIYINKYNSIFIKILVEKNKYKFHYGKKPNLNRLKNLNILLPATNDGRIDYVFMEKYIKDKIDA